MSLADGAPTIPTLVIDGPRRNCRNRLFEWCTTGIMLGIAVSLVLTPEAVHTPTFRYVPLDAGAIFAFFLVGGTMRALALYLNGRWPIYGPRLRAAAAAAAAVLWFWMWWSLVHQDRPLTPGVSVYLFFVIGEVVSCMRAARDGRHHR